MFSRKTEEQATQKIFEKYGLDINNHDANKIKQENYNNLKQITQDIAANPLFKAGLAFSFASADKQAIVGYLSTLVNQNWILIRQNELIIRLLEKK